MKGFRCEDWVFPKLVSQNTGQDYFGPLDILDDQDVIRDYQGTSEG